MTLQLALIPFFSSVIVTGAHLYGDTDTPIDLVFQKSVRYGGEAKQTYHDSLLIVSAQVTRFSADRIFGHIGISHHTIGRLVTKDSNTDNFLDYIHGIAHNL